MPSILDFAIPTEEVQVTRDFSLTVRGLSLTDISHAMQTFGGELTGLYERFVVGTESEDLPSPQNMAQTLMQECPALVALLIALANDEPGAEHKCAELPAMVQVKALIAIGRLTFQSEEEVKNLVESVILGGQLLSRMLGATDDPKTLKH